MDTPLQPHPEISTQDDGSLLVEFPDAKITIMPDGEKKAFARNAIKIHSKEHTRWAVCELDGVRLYKNGQNFVLTKQDLFP